MDEEKLICQLLEINYIKSRGGEITLDNKYYDLFPTDWYIYNNYQKKIEILAEATEKNILIIDTDGYQDIIEKVIY